MSTPKKEPMMTDNMTPSEYAFASVVMGGPIREEPARPDPKSDWWPEAEVLALFGGAAGLELAQAHGFQSTDLYITYDIVGRKKIFYSRSRGARWLEEQRTLARLLGG